MNLYVPKYTKDICEHKGSTPGNYLPDEVKESSSLEVLKSNYRFYFG